MLYNLESEIAEALTSSQNQMDDPVQSITIEYTKEELGCSMPQLSPGSCFEGPSSNSRRSDGETTSADDCFVSFLHEGDPQVSNTLDELTGGSEIYL